MNIIAVEKLSKKFVDKHLFNNITFGIDSEDKIGLIGVNGAGKSTLLKVIAGDLEYDTGRIIYRRGLRIKYLAQIPNLDSNSTILEQIFNADDDKYRLVKEYLSTNTALQLNPHSEPLMQHIIDLSTEMDNINAWSLESEAKAILTKLGITDFSKKISELSGGQRKRVALAEALLTKSDLLILDEPTNHIDNKTIEWLEKYLIDKKSAVLMVTHDRYFLDRVTNRIIELDNFKIHSYEGNYSVFVEKKAERELEVQTSHTKLKNIYRKELAWMQRGARARSTKQKARINRFNDLKEDLNQFSENTQLEINVGASRLGKKVIELKEITKIYDSRAVIKNFSYTIYPNERIGIVGENGVGKSTLLNLISGTIEPNSGEIDYGKTVNLGYYQQEYQDINKSLKAIDYIKEVAEVMKTADGKIVSASQLLEMFLFTPTMQHSLIKKLSGGEQKRLYLLRVLMKSPNVLLLDEPTNDIDIQTLTILEQYISLFSGVVIAVSHDRYFLDKIATKILSINKSGQVEVYSGSYTDYLKSSSYNSKTESVKLKKDKKTDYNKKKKIKLSFNEQKEYDEIEDNIEMLETKIANVVSEINSAGSDYDKLNKLSTKHKKLEAELESLMERWEHLELLVAEIEKNKAER